MENERTDNSLIRQDMVINKKKKKPSDTKLYHFRGQIRKIFKGDTIILDIEMGFNIRKQDVKLKLYGYEAPLVNGSERVMGLVAKARLQEILPIQSWIIIRTQESRTFGQWFCEVTLPTGEDLVKKLIAEGYGVPWDRRGSRPQFDLLSSYPRPTDPSLPTSHQTLITTVSH